MLMRVVRIGPPPKNGRWHRLLSENWRLARDCAGVTMLVMQAPERPNRDVNHPDNRSHELTIEHADSTAAAPEERPCARHRNGDMQFALRKTSLDRLWTGFDAALCDTSGGLAETPKFPNHSVSMHVGAPIVATCRCDGAVHRRFQVPGDIDVIPAGFSGAWVDEGPTTVLIVNISPSLVRTAAEGMGIDPDRVSIQPQLQLKDPQVEHIGWALKAELETDEPFGRLYADSLGLALAAHLLRRYAPLAPRRLANGLSKRRLQRVVDYIGEHLTEGLPLAELANVANLSPSHFKVLFKKSVGVPVHQYVVRTRVECAIDLLVRDELAASDVALQTGFANQSHMARCMRRVAGITPSVLTREAS